MKTILHHVSIINNDIKAVFNFYRNILGLKLLMKTVNQDDHTMYHIFFSDAEGRPGTEVTFFEMKEGQQNRFGTNAIERLMFKVPSKEALMYWMHRFDEYGVCHYGIERGHQRDVLRFEGPDDTFLGLTVMHEVEDVDQYYTHSRTEVPAAYQIQALDTVHLRVRYPEATIEQLVDYYGWHVEGETPYFDTGRTVTILSNRRTEMYQEVHVVHDIDSPLEVQGFGGIHHVAFSTEDRTSLERIESQLDELNMMHSPIKNRGFFTSIYYRDPNLVLFEVATMKLNQHTEQDDYSVFEQIPLHLPEYLASERERIEAKLKHTSEQ